MMTNSLEQSGITIILLDDEDAILSAVSRMLSHLGHRCHTAKTGEAVISILDEVTADLVILDIKIIGGLGGIETMQRIRELGYEMPVISMSGYPANEMFINPAKREGFNDHIEKPFKGKQMSELIKTHCFNLST